MAPDLTGEQLRVIRSHLKEHQQIRFVWYDVRAARAGLGLAALSLPLLCRSRARCWYLWLQLHTHALRSLCATAVLVHAAARPRESCRRAHRRRAA